MSADRVIDNPESFFNEALWQLRTLRCPGCGRSDVTLARAGVAARAHHVVYEQEVRRRGGALHDTRNAMGVCDPCHARHHDGTPWRLALSALTAEHHAFAAELLGDSAGDYLARRYGSSTGGGTTYGMASICAGVTVPRSTSSA